MHLPVPSVPLSQQPTEVLLAMLLFGEARNQGRDGMIAVANTVRNRIGAPRNARGSRFGMGWAGVILRPGAFDCFRATDPNFPKMFAPLQFEQPEVWAACLGIAEMAVAGMMSDNTRGATHYHDRSVRPWWASPDVVAAGRMIPTVTIGALLFYREP